MLNVESSGWPEATAAVPKLHVVRKGLVPYREALTLQRELARRLIAGELTNDTLLLVEHPPVITLGRSTKAGHVVAGADLLAARGVELCEAERGGDVTFHGPGQIVGYPVLNLRNHKQDLHWYLRQLEEVLIVALARSRLAATRRPGQTGVWIHVGEGGREPRKIASIGVHAKDWVTWHGFALNVTTDLSWFDLIVPCGIDGVVMTSMARELGAGAPTVETATDHIVDAFVEVFRTTDPRRDPDAG
ncbi:MAG: lipoyl(octanoyl) transferase LipB [Gemmatimonadota bacterium]